MRAVVVGAGVAGTATALGLARDGHDVVLVDPAPAPTRASPDELFAQWERPGVGQFHQPHNFLGRGRRVLRERFADVYAGLARAGAGELDMTQFLGSAPPEPGDEDLATVLCRRPVFDAVLRQAAVAQTGLDERHADVTALALDGAHVRGVTLSTGEHLRADVVVDAAGRSPHTARWLADAGLEPWPEDTVDCGLLYYSRHYAVRDGQELPPPASLLGGPRGDLGYLAFAVFLGDNATYSVCVMAPSSDRSWRALREPDAFDRVVASLPGMAAWLEVVRPVSGVLPMGALRNTLRHPLDGERVRTPGLVAVGDARCHTNPTFAFGATLSLWHAAVVTDAARDAADAADLARRVEEQVGPDAAARFQAVAAEDDDRRRLWSGEPIDLEDPADAPGLHLRSVVYRVAPRDPELLRAVARRINGLGDVDELRRREDLLRRAGDLYAELKASFPPPPPREQLVAALSRS